jgi:Heterokaryon incompatibility protein (HET)
MPRFTATLLHISALFKRMRPTLPNIPQIFPKRHVTKRFTSLLSPLQESSTARSLVDVAKPLPLSMTALASKPQISLRGLSFKERFWLPDASTHIRLVHLNPCAEFSAPLRCTLEVCSIKKTPSYVALSYAWGEGGETNSIAVEGAGEIEITPKLAECLRHLRSPTTVRTLWIDQICINQKVIFEKQSQIPLMRHIYMNAQHVLA